MWAWLAGFSLGCKLSFLVLWPYSSSIDLSILNRNLIGGWSKVLLLIYPHGQSVYRLRIPEPLHLVHRGAQCFFQHCRFIYLFYHPALLDFIFVCLFKGRDPISFPINSLTHHIYYSKILWMLSCSVLFETSLHLWYILVYLLHTKPPGVIIPIGVVWVVPPARILYSSRA